MAERTPANNEIWNRKEIIDRAAGEVIVISDVPGEATWLSFNGHSVDYVREASGYIVGTIDRTQDVEDCLAAFRAGPRVDLLNFLDCQRRERGKMLDLRNGRVRNGRHFNDGLR